MTDNNDVSVSTNAPKPTPNSSSKRPYLLPITVIIAFIMAFSAVWISWQNACQERRQYMQLDAQLKQQQLNMAHLAKHWQTSNTRLQHRLTDVNQQLKATLNQRHDNTQDWILLKARYYLELAQINAHWSENQTTTIALLEQADTILQPLSLPAVLPVRQAIAKDISRLKSLPIIDIAGLLSQLDAMQSLIIQLPIQQTNQLTANTTETSDKATPSAWRARLRESMSMLEKLVVVTHQEDGIAPMLSPLHQTVLRESLRLNLQVAEWAVLQHNDAIYQQSLTKAIKDIQRIFENSSARQALIQQLQALQQQKLNTTKPSEPQALLLLNQLIDNTPAHSETPNKVTS